VSDTPLAHHGGCLARARRLVWLLWPARTALACGLASLPHLFFEDKRLFSLLGTGMLFAAICSTFVSQATLGATLRVAFLCARACSGGGLLAAAVVAAVGTSDAAIYVSLVLGSLLIVLPTVSPVTTRMAWATYVACLASALELRGDFSRLFPLKLAFASLVGTAAAVLLVLPRWPGSRALALSTSALASCGRDAAAAALSLSSVLSAGEARYGLLRAHADARMACAAGQRDSVLRVAEELAWETGLAARSFVVTRLELLRQVELYIRGTALALRAQREEDAHQSEQLLHLKRAGGGADGDCSEVATRAAALTAQREAILETYQAQALAMDAMLAQPAQQLAQAVCALMPSVMCEPGSGNEAAARRRCLAEALTAFDVAVTDARTALFYAPRSDCGDAAKSEAQARVEAMLAISGPRVGRYLFCFCLRSLAVAVLASTEAAKAAHPPQQQPQQPLPLRLRLRALMRSLSLPPDPSRWVYALKLTAAVTAAMAAGAAMSGSGLWSSLSVAFIAPRENASKHAGGSFRTAGLRLFGTIVGAIWGFGSYAVVATLDSSQQLRTGIALLLLAVGVFIFGLVRHSPRHAYGAIVAQFTPYVMGDMPMGASPRTWAYRRIEMNLIGVLIFVAVELFVLPRRAAHALREELAGGLCSASTAVAAVWEAQLAGGGGACAACRAAAAADVALQVAALAASVARQRGLLAEMADEPDWAPLSAASHAAPPIRACTVLVEEQARLVNLLGLMHAVLADAASHDEGEALGRLVTPCAPALRALLARVRERYAVLQEELLQGRRGDRSASSAARGSQALSAFEARTTAVFVGLLRAHRVQGAPVVPSRVIVPFLALCLCTRFLSRNVERMARAAADMGAESGVPEQDVETDAGSAAAAVLEHQCSQVCSSDAPERVCGDTCPVCHAPRGGMAGRGSADNLPSRRES